MPAGTARDARFCVSVLPAQIHGRPAIPAFTHPWLQTRTDSIDTAQNGDDIAVARASADSYSVQGDGTIARAFSTVQVCSVCGGEAGGTPHSGAGCAHPSPFHLSPTDGCPAH